MQILVSALEMREMDRRTIEELAVPGRVLMEVAGRRVAEVCARRLTRPSRVAVACGTGNTGGDGFVAARALMALGHEVRVFVFGDQRHLKGDARSALDGLERFAADVVIAVGDPKELWAFASYLSGADLAVDALLGTGLSSEVRGLLGDAHAPASEGRTTRSPPCRRARSRASASPMPVPETPSVTSLRSR